MVRHVWGLLTKTYRLWREDNGVHVAAGLTYYILLSTAPLMVILVGVIGRYLGRSTVVQQVLRHANTLAGRLGEEFVRNLITAAAPGSRAISIVAGAIALAGIMRFFAELRTAFNQMWDVPPIDPPKGSLAERAWWWLRKEAARQFVTFAMVVLVMTLLIASVLASSILRVLSDTVPPIIRVGAGLRALEAGVSVLLVTVLFAVVYRYLPRTRIAWRDVIVGAAASAALFVLGRLMLGLYFTYGDPGSAYGAAGSLVALLVWINLSVRLALVGAEFTYVWAHEHGSRTGEPEREPAKTRSEAAARAAEGTRRARTA